MAWSKLGGDRKAAAATQHAALSLESFHFMRGMGKWVADFKTHRHEIFCRAVVTQMQILCWATTATTGRKARFVKKFCLAACAASHTNAGYRLRISWRSRSWKHCCSIFLSGLQGRNRTYISFWIHTSSVQDPVDEKSTCTHIALEGVFWARLKPTIASKDSSRRVFYFYKIDTCWFVLWLSRQNRQNGFWLFFGCFVKFAKSVGSGQALLVLSAVIASSVNMINIFIIAKVRESNRGRNDPYIGFASSNSFHSISIHF